MRCMSCAVGVVKGDKRSLEMLRYLGRMLIESSTRMVIRIYIL